MDLGVLCQIDQAVPGLGSELVLCEVVQVWLGMVAPGKSADFVVLNANPLDNIANTRKIDKVYLRGQEVNRAAMRAAWTGK